MLKIRDWVVDIDTLILVMLSHNTNSIELLKENQDEINWNNLSRNPNAIYIKKKSK